MELREQLQQTLGDSYTLERELGGGGMSRVFVSEEHALGRKVVVKVLPPTLAGGVNIERFKREIQLAARLQHAHIVPVLTAGETHGLPYYTMPFVDGESLRGRLGRGPLSLTETISVLRDVARALAYAHDHGVVHRDIKPDNVMLAGGSAVVTDFGIAKAIAASRSDRPEGESEIGLPSGELTALGISLGTPTYMAPEQAAADPATDHRADLYAFGCMAYEMLAGVPPFVEKSPQQLLAAHMAKAPDPIGARRADVPPALAALVMRCLAKEASARPASALEIARTLDTVTSGGSHAALPPILVAAPGAMKRALLGWTASLVVIGVMAKAAIVLIGLPDWVFPGAILVMLLGLPVILFTWYVQRVLRRSMADTPTYTPGGTAANTAQGTMATMAIKASPHVSWHRTTMGGVYAVVAFAVVVAGFMALRALGVGPGASLLGRGSLKTSDQILVAEFTSADSSLGGVLAEAMRTSLTQSKRVAIVQASAVAGALQRMARPVSTRLTPALAREMAQREGIKAIVTGEVTSLSGGYVVTARLLSSSSGDVLTSFQQSANGAADLIPAMDRLGRQLRSKIGESLRDVQGAPPLAKVSTASIEALRKFTEGARANDFEGNYDDAVTALREAVALDSNFAMAYRKLAIALGNVGNRPEGARVIERGYALRDRIPEAERLALEATYFDRGPHPDRNKVIDRYTQLFQKYPEWLTIITTNQLANMYESRRAFAVAESLNALAIRVAPDESSPFGIIARVQINQGKFAEARASIIRAEARKTRYPDRQERLEGLLLYNEGHVDSARAVLLRNTRSPDTVLAVMSQLDLAALDLGAGRIRESVERRLSVGTASGEPPVPFTETTLGVRVANRLLQQPAEAQRRLDAVYARRRASSRSGTPLVDDLADAALEAEVGRPDRARALVQRYDAAPLDTVQRRLGESPRHLALGWIAIAEGRGLDAARELRESDQLRDGPNGNCYMCIDPAVGIAFDRANLPDSAIATFEHFLKSPYYARHNVDAQNLAWVLRRLGELYEAKGDAAKARGYYQRFVDLWKGADVELQPQVAAVQSRLKRLDEVERRSR